MIEFLKNSTMKLGLLSRKYKRLMVIELLTIDCMPIVSNPFLFKMCYSYFLLMNKITKLAFWSNTYIPLSSEKNILSAANNFFFLPGIRLDYRNYRATFLISLGKLLLSKPMHTYFHLSGVHILVFIASSNKGKMGYNCNKADEI